jgi:hypothetical protein
LHVLLLQVCSRLGRWQRPAAPSEACVGHGQAAALHTGHAYDGENLQHRPRLLVYALVCAPRHGLVRCCLHQAVH